MAAWIVSILKLNALLNANFLIYGSKIAQRSQPLVNLRIISQNSADFSIPWKDLHWVETECAGISQSAGTSVFIHCSENVLRRIFNDDEAMELRGSPTDRAHVAQPAGDKLTGKIALVREAIAGSICETSMLRSSPMSTKIGVAPVITTAFTVATDDMAGNDHLIARADVMSTQR